MPLGDAAMMKEAVPAHYAIDIIVYPSGKREFDII